MRKIYNNVYYLNVWDYDPNKDYELLYQAIKQKKIHTICILYAEEHTFANFTDSPETFFKFEELCKKHNIKLEIINGCTLKHNFNYRWKILPALAKSIHSQIITWETFFAHLTVLRSLEMNQRPLGHTNVVNKHFISMNGRPHYHRCLFIDYMYKEDLFKHGYISWLNYGNIKQKYKFKYWSPKIIKFDPSFVLTPYSHNEMVPPVEFQDSLFSVVCESSVNAQLITEKTYMPIWNRRPFLIFGHPNANLYLTSLGFKLFDEVIDYSFDSVDDDEERCRQFMKQVKKLCSYDIDKLRIELMPKVHFNWLNLISIISSREMRSKLKRHLPSNVNYNPVQNYRHLLDIAIKYRRVLANLNKHYYNKRY